MSDEKGTKEKPLDKMTIKELRDIAKEIPEIIGIHGMNKEDLLSAVKKARGIEEPVKKASSSIRELKKKIRALKIQRDQALAANDAAAATICRRRISRLKKKTRKAA